MVQFSGSTSIFDKEGTPLHTWRVLLLPYLGEEGLYSRFKLDEPWDSEHNLPLSESMPDIYRCPSARNDGTERTTPYQVFDGFLEHNNEKKLREVIKIRKPITPYWIWERTAFVSDPKHRLWPHRPLEGKVAVFEAGTDRVSLHGSLGVSVDSIILVAEAHVSAPWTKPLDLSYHPQKPLPALGRHPRRGFNAVSMGVQAHFVSNADEQRIRSFIAPLQEAGEGDWNN